MCALFNSQTIKFTTFLGPHVNLDHVEKARRQMPDFLFAEVRRVLDVSRRDYVNKNKHFIALKATIAAKTIKLRSD